MRRALFPVALVCMVFAVLEMASFLTMSVLQGTWYGYADLAAARAKRGMGWSTEADAVEPQDNSHRFFPGFTLALHPYLGFSLTGSGTLTTDPVQSLGVLGFHDALGVLVRERNPRRTVVGIFGGSVAQNLAWSSEAMDVLRTRLREHPAFRDTDIVITAPALGGYKQPQ